MQANEPRLTLDEVVETERRAWAAPEGGESTVTYGGIGFWISDGTRSQRAVRSELPQDGWWHRANCNCHICREVQG